MSKVTVISAIFNIVKAGRVEVFRKCLESVHNQTHKDIEHLVIDGGSADGTLEILKKYERKGWIKYVSEPDNGIYDAMNKGAGMATGDYIAFLNSDDYWFDKKGIERSVKELDAQQGDFSFAPSYTTLDDFPIQKCDTSLGNFFMRMPFCHQTMLTRRDVFLELGGFDTDNYRSAGDFHFILRLILSGHKPVYVPCNFTAYSHGGFSAVDMEASAKDCVKAIFTQFKLIDPAFTMADARKAFYGHAMSEEMVDKIMKRVDPQVALRIGELRQQKDDKGNIRYTLDDYTHALYESDFIRDTHWEVYSKEVSWFGLPVYSRKDTAADSQVSILGIPVWSKRSE